MMGAQTLTPHWLSSSDWPSAFAAANCLLFVGERDSTMNLLFSFGYSILMKPLQWIHWPPIEVVLLFAECGCQTLHAAYRINDTRPSGYTASLPPFARDVPPTRNGATKPHAASGGDPQWHDAPPIHPPRSCARALSASTPHRRPTSLSASCSATSEGDSDRVDCSSMQNPRNAADSTIMGGGGDLPEL